ncbi:carboxypeptidase-like regulatory domain-containing protein [Chitinophaga pinensis]|uniref:TonB-dependent receptor plug domain-containing protein n=1 Tax=Chitinophaga pinensis TaxID=79329 RepID=A0A5C6LLF1_9BACT|nr:carboxypeptidase-like regulatory domain-containing protein [Chitinophaga pinensis]TWV97403.1 hypothetical protein FEF09_22355 [Chitinophaga pinensis]
MLLLLICAFHTHISLAAIHSSGPPITISGKIIARDGTPVIGATIRVKGSGAGATTNASGVFTLTAIPDNAVLVISSMGYNTMEFTLKPTEKGISATPAKATDAENIRLTEGPAPYLNITLSAAVQELGESVVIAYGTVKKRDLTGSVVSIKEADITATPVNNAMEALQGKVAGMDIMRGSGAVGTNVNILLRGSRSIMAITALFLS